MCVDPKQVIDSERHILGDGGEGIILRSPCSFYHHGRSTSLLKWKVFLSSFSLLIFVYNIITIFDFEAKIINKASLEDKEALVVSVGTTYNLLLYVPPSICLLIFQRCRVDIILFSFTSLMVFNSPDGTSFDVQQKDVKPNLTLANGDVVTFSYNMFSRRALPADPFVYRVRHDMIWRNVLAQAKEGSSPHPPFWVRLLLF